MAFKELQTDAALPDVDSFDNDYEFHQLCLHFESGLKSMSNGHLEIENHGLRLMVEEKSEGIIALIDPQYTELHIIRTSPTIPDAFHIDFLTYKDMKVEMVYDIIKKIMCEIPEDQWMPMSDIESLKKRRAFVLDVSSTLEELPELPDHTIKPITEHGFIEVHKDDSDVVTMIIPFGDCVSVFKMRDRDDLRTIVSIIAYNDDCEDAIVRCIEHAEEPRAWVTEEESIAQMDEDRLALA